MDAKGLKQLLFVVLIFIILAVVFIMASNIDLLTANALWIILAAVFIILFWKFDFLLTLKEFERAVIMRFGKVVRVGGPGWCLLIPGIENATLVDLRTQTLDIPKQDVITKDNIELKVDAIIYLRVRKDSQSVINSVVEIEDYREAIKLYVISLVRETIGSMDLPDVIAKTDEVEKRLQTATKEVSKDWGVEVVSVEVKDIDIPRMVIDAMHLQKAAVQEKLARVERAQAHMAEIDAVKRAAEQLSDRALAYYYVRALEKMAEGKSTKFIFPMELSRLAEAIGGRVAGKSAPNVEQLFKKYAPAVTAILNKNEKKQIEQKVKKEKKK